MKTHKLSSGLDYRKAKDTHKYLIAYVQPCVGLRILMAGMRMGIIVMNFILLAQLRRAIFSGAFCSNGYEDKSETECL